MPNMALRRVSDIRPHLVLECSFEQKCFGDKRERRAKIEEKSRFLWEIILISGFQVIKEKEGS